MYKILELGKAATAENDLKGHLTSSTIATIDTVWYETSDTSSKCMPPPGKCNWSRCDLDL